MAASFIKKIGRNSAVQHAAGSALAGYIKLLHATTRKVNVDTFESRAAIERHLPAIFTFWHGEHFLVGMAAPSSWNLHAMISRSADGTINAIAVEKLGVTPVRGAGDPKKRGKAKGGARAFLAFMDVLEAGGSVGLTADVPKVARQVSPGLIRLAKKSGRPLIPTSYVTHPRITAKSWDRASIGLPFTRAGIGVGEPFYIDQADEREESELCAILHDRLEALERQCYAAIGGRSAFADTRTGSIQHAATEEASKHG